MLLQCETDCGASRASIRRRCGCAADTRSLIDLNEVCPRAARGAGARQQREHPASQIAALWACLWLRAAPGAGCLCAARRRLRRTRRGARPRRAGGRAARAGYPPFFTVAPAAKVTQAIFTLPGTSPLPEHRRTAAARDSRAVRGTHAQRTCARSVTSRRRIRNGEAAVAGAAECGGTCARGSRGSARWSGTAACARRCSPPSRRAAQRAA
jgi:hypothetical protein